MTEKMLKLKNVFYNFKNKISSFFEEVFSSTKKTIILTCSIVSFTLFFIFMYILLFNNSFYQNWSDDILQYYTIISDFINGVKRGELSLFNLNNYLGASYFSDAYYIPLDIFTFITFVLSYIMNVEIAYSTTEFIKIALGVFALCYFLKLKKSKNSTIFICGLLYFASGGIANFMAFPVFLSLAFYLPVALIVIYLFVNKKHFAFLVPLFIMCCVFYNFYITYYICAFAFIAYIVMGLTKEELKLKEYFLKLIYVFFLICLGVMMALIIFYPSVKFITEASFREDYSAGYPPFKIVETIKAYGGLVIGVLKYLWHIFLSFFKFGGNYFTNIKNTINLEGETLSSVYNTAKTYLFDLDYYYRVLTKTFVPSEATDFYGFLNDYCIEHVSLYITGIGFIIASYVFFMNDRKSNVYKITIFALAILIVIPLASYAFAGRTDVPYTRWLNFIPLFEIILVAHVLDTKGLKYLSHIKMSIVILISGMLIIDAFLFNFRRLKSFEEGKSFNTDLINYESQLAYMALIIIGLIAISIIGFIIYDKFKLKKRFFPLFLIPVIALIILLIIPVKNASALVPDGITTSSGTLFSIDEIRIDQYILLATLICIMLSLVGFWIKKPGVIYAILIVECIISTVYSFYSPMAYGGKQRVFNEGHKISDFLDKYIEQDEFFRVYVDSSAGGFEACNFQRMTRFYTNTEIFHSFTDSETDDLTYMLFNTKERQTKEKLNSYSYYLNYILGYKYVLVGDQGFEMDQHYFTKIAEENGLYLYEIKQYRTFNIYDEIVTKESFNAKKSSLSEIAKQKLLVEYAIVDSMRFENVDIEEKDITDYQNITSNTVTAYSDISYDNISIEEIDGEKYQVYSFKDNDELRIKTGAVYVKYRSGTWLNFNYVEKAIEDQKIYIKYSNGEKEYATLGTKGEDEYIIHAPFYDLGEDVYPEALYILSSSSTKFTINYRIEEAVEHSDGNLYAYVIYKIPESLQRDSGVMMYSISGTTLDYVMLETATSKSYVFPGEINLTEAVDRVYVYKNGYLYDQYSLPSLSITYLSSIEEVNERSYTDYKFTVNHNKIHLSYTNTDIVEGKNRLVVLPITYSEEWKQKDTNYEIVSANGGFIGIVVPANIEKVDITLKYVPNGLKLGALGSLAGFTIYGLIFGLPLIIKKKKEAHHEENINNSASL